MDVQEAIKKRRAYRSLDPVDISDDIIKDLAESAQLAPSCANKQPWKFIFVKNRDKLKQLFKVLSPGNKWVKKASMIIAMFSNQKDDCIIKERLYYLFDTGMAAAFIQLRATELGLVAHPIAGFDEDKAKAILNIPEEMRLITLINVGKHSKEINPTLSEPMKLGEKQRPPRKSLKEFTYIDQYGEKFHE